MQIAAAIGLALAATAVPVETTHVADLPVDVRVALKMKMADAGAPWQATDVIVTPGLPFARLVRASHDGTTWTVEYERGGIGYSHHRAVLRLVDGRYVVADEWLYGHPTP